MLLVAIDTPPTTITILDYRIHFTLLPLLHLVVSELTTTPRLAPPHESRSNRKSNINKFGFLLFGALPRIKETDRARFQQCFVFVLLLSLNPPLLVATPSLRQETVVWGTGAVKLDGYIESSPDVEKIVIIYSIVQEEYHSDQHIDRDKERERELKTKQVDCKLFTNQKVLGSYCNLLLGIDNICWKPGTTEYIPPPPPPPPSQGTDCELLIDFFRLGKITKNPINVRCLVLKEV